MGFNCNKSGEKSCIYSDYVGRVGHYSVGSVGVTGVLKEINFDKGYVAVQPSLVGRGKYIRIEEDSPTIISITQGNPLAIRPLKDGDLVKMVEESNNNVTILETKQHPSFFARVKYLFFK